MRQIDKIPAIWRQDVHNLQAQGIRAVLAGGAMRDLYCGRQPKDIDIFILGDNGRHINDIMLTLGGSWESKTYNQFSRGYKIDYVIERTDFTPIQVIGVGVETTEDLIKEFDYGLCQIAYDGTHIVHTAAFRRDFQDGTLTLTNVHAYDRALERYATWTEHKYKGWPFVPTGIVLREQLIRKLKGKPSEQPACEISTF